MGSKADLGAVVVSSLVAGTAYMAVAELDNRLTGENQDDLTLLGRFVTEDPRRARKLGAVLHLANSVPIGLAYATVGRRRLMGPPWLRGVTFALIENTVLYPLARLEDHHPAIKDGSVARYWSGGAFLHSLPRHIAFGAVLGSLYERLRH